MEEFLAFVFVNLFVCWFGLVWSICLTVSQLNSLEVSKVCLLGPPGVGKTALVEEASAGMAFVGVLFFFFFLFLCLVHDMFSSPKVSFF